MLTNFKQWLCGHTRKNRWVKSRGHNPGSREKLVGARYRIKCLSCDKVLFEDVNLNKEYERVDFP